MENTDTVLKLQFDGTITDRSQFLHEIRDLVTKFTKEIMTLDAVINEIVKNIFDHADGRGSLVIRRLKGGFLEFHIQDEGKETHDFEYCRTHSRLAGKTGHNYGIGLDMITDLAGGLGIHLKVDTCRGFSYSGVYTPRNIKQTTLVFCLKENNVLLGMKKTSFGSGWWNGFGGKLQPPETFEVAAVRELYEESRLVTTESDLTLVARIKFFFGDTPMFDCSVYLTRKWSGEPVETNEMRPQWFSIDNLPFAEMWPADVHWIPGVLAGSTIEATVTFDTEGKRVVSFESKSVTF